MADILISYSDKTINDLVDPETPIRIIRSTEKTQFYTKNIFKPNQVLVLDTTIIKDKDFVNWAVVNTRVDLIVLVYDNFTIDLKPLKNSKKHKVQVIEKEPLPKDNIFAILDQVMRGVNRQKVYKTLNESVALFPLLLKWLISSYDLFSEENQKVIEEIDERYMRRNTDAIIRNLAFGIKPETKSFKFKWSFPKKKEN